MPFGQWRRAAQLLILLSALIWMASSSPVVAGASPVANDASPSYARPKRPAQAPVPQRPRLGEPPALTPAEIERRTIVQRPLVGPRAPGHSRADVVNLFNAEYTPPLQVAPGWTGSIAGCVPGVTSPAYEAATVQIVNYFRTMVGLPAVTLDSTRTAGAQSAALMMLAQGDLSHDPPPGWACRTDAGALSASQSNLSLGSAGPSAVVDYMNDTGVPSLGHRRWVIYPREVQIGTGSTSASNALHVIGGFGVRPVSPEYVTWPPAGFVPYQVVYPTWSFTYPDADFTGATVSMTYLGNPIALNTVQLPNNLGDNGISWLPQGLTTGAGVADRAYVVNVNNVVVNAVPRNFTFTVTIVDPALAPPVSCAPRPRPTMTVARIGPGTIQATIAATGANNTLVALRIGVPPRAMTNASLDVQGVLNGVTNGQSVTLPNGATQAVLIVTRLAAGTATVPLVVVDGCGDWPTFVGMGPGVS